MGQTTGRDVPAQQVLHPKQQAAVCWTQALTRWQHVCSLCLPPKNTVGNLKSVSGVQEPQILWSTEQCAPPRMHM